MKKYKNINDSFDYKGIIYVELNQLVNLDINENDFYLQFLSTYRGCSYQCIKSEENKSLDKISEFNEDEHVRMGDLDVEGGGFYRDDFDETNEVFDGNVNVISLLHIDSIHLKKKLIDKIIECQNEQDENISISEFFNWFLGIEEYHYSSQELDERFNDFYEKLNGDNENLKLIFDEIETDEEQNLVDWFSYDMFEYDYLFIGYRKKPN